MPNATLKAPLASFPWAKCFNQFHAPRILTRQQPLWCYLAKFIAKLGKKIAAAHMFHEFTAKASQLPMFF